MAKKLTKAIPVKESTLIGFGTMREQLMETSVEVLFNHGGAKDLIIRKDAAEDLDKIVKSDRGDNRLRIIAHELMLMMDIKVDTKMIKIYCEGIEGSFMHHLWGCPGIHLGLLGKSIIRFGEYTIQYLIPDLDNKKLLTSIGPDAIINRTNLFCVGDLIYYFLTLILKRECKLNSDPDIRKKQRDELFDELSRRVADQKRKVKEERNAKEKIASEKRIDKELRKAKK